MVVLVGVSALSRACSGLWQYLAERVRGRTRVQLERARNEATAEAIRLLPSGAELWETEPDGRTRIIRMPMPSTTASALVHRQDAQKLPPR
jgi:hypothetical protein